MSRIPIIVVLGATGTGKSKLAIQIAKRFNGEIISADSMQVYKGLDIASNKITEMERAEVPHHMLDICGPMDRFSVYDYRNRTLPIIEDILKRCKLPIIVGGTNYYIESILWYNLLTVPDENKELIFNRFQLINNPTEINKWRSYERSVLSELKSSHSPLKKESDIPLIEKAISLKDIDNLIKSIEKIQNDFSDTLKKINNRIKISFSLYKRTFYKIPNMQDESERNHYDVMQCAELESKFTNVVDIETVLMNYYLCFTLEQISLSTFDATYSNIDSNDNIFSHFNRFWNTSVVSQVLLEKTFHVHNFDLCMQQIRNSCSSNEHIISKYYLTLNNVIKNIEYMAKIRTSRLELLRIVDDEIMLDYSNEELYNELKLFNADAFRFFHPNNRRKIIRAIQIYFTSGKTYTEMINEQHMMKGGCAISPAMRYPDSCILWLYCDQVILDKRLDERVDSMLKNDLINELENFHKQYNLERLKYNKEVDYSKGVFQSIGLKEFHSYLMLEDEKKWNIIGKKKLQLAVKSLKTATKRYSRLQFRTIMNRYIRIPDIKKVPPIFKLDCSNMEKWKENVEFTALSIVKDYIDGNDLYTLTYLPMDREEPHPNRFQDGEYYCDICQRIFVGQYQWSIHYASKGHRRQLYKLKLKDLHKKMVMIGKPQKKDINNVDEDEDENLLKLLL